MKLNYIGIIAAILAFASLALPWWQETFSQTILGTTYSYSLALYPWGASVSGVPYASTIGTGQWWTYGALALIILSGLIGLAGSAMPTSMGKMLLFVTGILAILSAIIFVVGFITAVPQGSQLLFYNVAGISTSLWIGWGLALVAGILAFIAWIMHPKPTAPSP